MGDTAAMAEAPSPGRFVDLLAPALLQAARVARVLEGRVANRPKTGEGSAVKAALTAADSAAQEAILGPLFEHFPDVGLEAEEDTPTVSRFGGNDRVRVVIDPIDGTLSSYLERRGPYGVMVGLWVDGRFGASLVALPREDLLFDATRDGTAHVRNGEGPARPALAEADGTGVLVSHEMPEGVLDRLRERGFEPAFACGGAISVAPLVEGVRAGLRIANSSGGISIRGRIGLTIARAAAARVVTESGEIFPEETGARVQGLVVAADPADLGPLTWALSAGF
jgi:hypothetical protein